MFAFFYVITQIRVCEDDKGGFECDVVGWDDYPKISKFYALFLMTFRISLGNVNTPNYKSWVNKINETRKTTLVAIYMIWIIWFINIFVMVIVMLNFLIAEVGNTY